MRFRFHSLRYRILLAVFGVSVPALILFFAMNTYAVNKIQQQIYENNLNLLNAHVSTLDRELRTASSYLVNESIDKVSINNFASTDDEEKYQGTILYHLKHVNTLSKFEMMRGQIIYSPINDNAISYFNEYNSDYSIREKVLEYVKNHAKELYELNGEWKTFRINDKWVLLSAAGNEKIVFCFWTTYDLLMKPVEGWKLAENNHFSFTNREGELLSEQDDEELRNLSYDGDLSSYYFSGDKKKYLMSGVESSIGDFKLMNAVERNSSLGVFAQIRILGIFLLILVLFVGVPGVIRVLNNSIFVPIDRMEKGIREVESGNLEVQIENIKSGREMEHLIQSFNKMTFQIRDLKIHTYEDALERQKLELDYLNLQIKPHFYLNALNLINAMAQMGDRELIREMTENLSQYMRYVVGSRKIFVTIHEELEHVRHYLKIMEMRFEEGFHYREDVEDLLLTFEIPPLIIHTLVENSMKYAFDVYRETIIEVHVRQEEKCVVICVKDNGEGYSQEYLEQYNTNQAPKGNHIGIMNLRSRVEMMYPGKAKVHIYNLEPRGACAEIRIQSERNTVSLSD